MLILITIKVNSKNVFKLFLMACKFCNDFLADLFAESSCCFWRKTSKQVITSLLDNRLLLFAIIVRGFTRRFGANG